VSSAADCSPIGLRFVLNLAYRGRSSIRQRDPAGFTRSSTTASGSWRTAAAGAFACSLANDLGDRFPLAAAAIEALPVRSCVIDGEAIVCDDNGLAVFDLIRGHATNASAILCAFDLLEVNGEDIRREPIEDRKRRLSGLLRLPHDGIALNEAFSGEGAVIYKHACALGCEGIVSKRLGSPYRAGRSAHWLKIKNPNAPAVRRLEEEDWANR
jgi:bifunctional non-homologous end joining protein LigD